MALFSLLLIVPMGTLERFIVFIIELLREIVWWIDLQRRVSSVGEVLGIFRLNKIDLFICKLILLLDVYISYLISFCFLMNALTLLFVFLPAKKYKKYCSHSLINKFVND